MPAAVVMWGAAMPVVAALPAKVALRQTIVPPSRTLMSGSGLTTSSKGAENDPK